MQTRSEGTSRINGENTAVIMCRSNPIDPDPRVEKEARALVEAGYRVEVIAWDRTAALPEVAKRDGFQIHRLAIQADYATGMGNLPALLRWLWGLTVYLIRNRSQFDVIHACDFDTVLPCLISKGFFGKKVIYDIFDFYADHLRKTPAWIKSLIRAVDLQAVGWADAVIIVDRARREQIADGNPRRLAVIYNTPEDVDLEEGDSGDDRASDLNIVYVGLLQEERGLFEQLEVMERHPAWHLNLAGFGGDEDRIVDKVRSLPNVSWYGRVPYQRTLQLTAAADVSVATYDPTIPNHRYASPNKVFEAMMLSKPLVVAQGTNMDRIVERWECGIVISYGSVLDLEQALSQLAADPSMRKRLGENGRQAYEERFAWDKMKERLLEVYQSVLEGKEA